MASFLPDWQEARKREIRRQQRAFAVITWQQDLQVGIRVP